LLKDSERKHTHPPTQTTHRRAELQQQRDPIAEGWLELGKPLYQVLSLPEESPPPASPRTGQVQSVGDILRRALEGGAQ
jgi:hypothetical protein